MEHGVGINTILVIAFVISLAGIIHPFRPFKRRRIAVLSCAVCFILFGELEPYPEYSKTVPSKESFPADFKQYWVTTARLNRRTCPSEDCGVVGQLFFREGTLILERRDGWARVTEPYDAFCVTGRSEYVDSGNSLCEASNGITDGRFAEWVSAEYLSEDRAPDPVTGASSAEHLVAGSDDFERYRTTFAEIAQYLIEQQRCTENDFREMGGWIKSSSHANEPIYFTYCGGATISNRLYLNAETSELFG